MLIVGQRYEFQGSTTKLDDEQLANKNTNDYQNKKIIVVNVSADVNFILFELSGIEKVKHLQEDKHIEENTQVNACFRVPIIRLDSQTTFDTEKFWHEKNNSQDYHLEDSVKNDVSPH